MKERICELCKVDLSFARVPECTYGGSVHTLLCVECRTALDRKVMALPQARRQAHLAQSIDVLKALAQSGKDTRAEVAELYEEHLTLAVEIHDLICAMLGRTATM